MRKLLIALTLMLGAVATTANAQSLSSTVNLNTNPIVIQYSGGGRIDAFEQEFARIRASGQQVIINGECTSACTMVLMLSNVCATDRATLGFHQAWQPTMFGKQPAPQATRQMSRYWKPYAWTWLRQHGGLTADVKHMGAPEIFNMVRQCSTTNVTQTSELPSISPEPFSRSRHSWSRSPHTAQRPFRTHRHVSVN